MTPDFLLIRAGPERLSDALRLVTAFHRHAEVAQSAERRRAAVKLVLDTPAVGALHLIEVEGRAIGYLVVAYGFSIEFGGRDAFLDEFYIEEAHRGAGLGAAAMTRLKAALREAGLHALHLEVDVENRAARRFYDGAGFAIRTDYHLMSARLNDQS